jgi:uncharacterized membrane protein YdjX (TVP38/TMEM64 family)
MFDDESAGDHGSNSRTQWWRPLLLLSFIATVILLAHLFGVKDHIGKLRIWIAALGAWGPLAFVLIYTAAVIVALPGSVLTLAGGALFGPVYGVILVSIASTLGASVDFLIARYFAREAVSRWIGQREQFRKLDQLTHARGAAIVALTRLVPLFPFNLLNYGFGLTSIRFRTYVFWSWLCMLPGTVLYVAGSDALFRWLEHGRVPWAVVTVIVCVAGLLALLVPMARRHLSSVPRVGDSSREDRA